jgi:hypothetical protein
MYANTPQTDFYLDIWSPVFVTTNASDSLFEIDPKYNKRPDLLSYDLYGTPNYWWIFALRNMDTLVDPINDFLSGVIIYIPQLTSIKSTTNDRT